MRAAFTTLGCKVNQYETAALMQQFAAAGFDIVDPDTEAEVYILNSCTVTAEGDRKSRQMLRRFKRRNPAAVTCLTGCFPQAFPDAARRIPEADIITGSKDRKRLLQAVERCLAGEGRIVEIAPHQKGDAFEEMRIDRSARTRAFVKIEDGCDRRCAYCIIPTARGPVRSKDPEALREELAALSEAGYKEVVLAGINLSSYGRDLGLRLTDALAIACSTPGIHRVRLGSLEPDLLAPEDIEKMAGLPPLCPQFHLSLQSGCDATLGRMRRRYRTGDYRRLVAELRRRFPRCAVTTDVMVGFPGETGEEFRESVDFVREMAFAKAHVFAYSPRPGTVAADLPDQVDNAEKRRRAGIMAEIAGEGRTAFLQAQVGAAAVLLAERETAPGRWEGYTENYTPVTAECPGIRAGELVSVAITETDGEQCFAQKLG